LLTSDARAGSARRRRREDLSDPSRIAASEPLVAGLFHVAVKTNDLDATVAFYTKILGLRNGFRPDFGYPGAWFYVPVAGGPAILHIYAGGPALGADGHAPAGTAAIDHVSLACRGFRGFVSRFREAGLDWREFLVPGTTLWQLFVYDPSGVQCELTFEGSGEDGPPPDMSPGRAYIAGSNFFDPATYPKLG
jgi:catechol 2,3-dioxygenase-like lactoylglutathione lyase family enzyme